MKTISEYLKSDRSLVIGTAVRETAKAVAFSVDGEKQLAWFPKSQAIFLKDDFYTVPGDKWAVPAWLANRKAAELGTFVHYIGG